MDSLRDSFYAKAYWKKKFMWTPRRCDLTSKWLWLTTAMEGVAMWTGPGDTVFEYRYHNVEEHVLWLIKN